MMWSYFVIIMSFLTGFLVIATVNLILSDLFQQDQGRMKQRLREEMVAQERERAKKSPLIQQAGGKDLQDLADEAAEEAKGEAISLRERLKQLSEQSGLRWSISKILSMMWGGFAVAAAATWLLSGSAIAAVPVGLIVATLPLAYLVYKKKKRLARLQEQLPDCFDLMARVIQSGQTITQALNTVAEEFEEPAGVEFGYCYEQQNLGLAPDLAYRDLARRTGVLELKIFVLALLVHRQTGGNLSSLLANLSHIVRERFTMRGKVKGLTAEGRMQGAILLGLPPLVYCMLLFANREYALKLFEHPSLLLVTGGAMLLGAVCINRIINFDF